MGLFPSFSFIVGTIFGVYVTQNYKIPNIKNVVYGTLFTAKQVEEKYRKPKKPGEDN